MNEKREKEILETAKKAYNQWQKDILINAPQSDIEPMVRRICEYNAFGIIVTTFDRQNLIAYIGTFQKCRMLKEKIGGRIDIICNWWFWLGNSSKQNVENILQSRRQNLNFQVLPQDLSDIIVKLAQNISYDIKYGNRLCKQQSYIGCWKICSLLKAKCGGYIRPAFDSWYWIGKADFKSIDEVCKKYTSQARRYQKKRIVI